MKVHRIPKGVGAVLGFADRTVWHQIRTDPDFPRPIRLSARIAVIADDDLQHYLDVKRQKSLAMAMAKAMQASGAKR